MIKSLAQELRNRNAKTEAWIAEDPANRWAGTYTEDLAHWAEMGITTVAQLDRYEMETTIWDLFKEVHGFRPRNIDFNSMSDEQLTEEYDSLLREMEYQSVIEAEYVAHCAEIEAEQERERLAWLAEQPEKIDYVAANYQEGWL